MSLFNQLKSESVAGIKTFSNLVPGRAGEATTTHRRNSINLECLGCRIVWHKTKCGGIRHSHLISIKWEGQTDFDGHKPLATAQLLIKFTFVWLAKLSRRLTIKAACWLRAEQTNPVLCLLSQCLSSSLELYFKLFACCLPLPLSPPALAAM